MKIFVFDDISQLGYEVDAIAPSSIYKKAKFPSKITKAFSNFINGLS